MNVPSSSLFSYNLDVKNKKICIQLKPLFQKQGGNPNGTLKNIILTQGLEKLQANQLSELLTTSKATKISDEIYNFKKQKWFGIKNKDI
jgi:hypothetical protein